MPNINSESSTVSGEIVSSYLGGVGINAETFIYPEEQTYFKLENTGTRRIFMSVNNEDITLAPSEFAERTIALGISSFTVRAEFGYQSFTATAKRPVEPEYLYLRSPDGSKWRLSIDNAGVTTWTKL